MDSNVVSYRSVALSELGNGVKGVVVDGELSSSEMNTQVIYFSKEQRKLKNPLCQEKMPNPTQRARSLISTDIDNDMKLEIPTVSTLPYVKESGAFTASDLVVWNSFSLELEELVPVQRTVVNYSYGYVIKLPEAWSAGTFTALLNEGGDNMRFCEWDKSSVGDNLFEINVFKVTDWDKGVGSDKYTLIYKDNRCAYAFVNYAPDNSELTLENDEIKTAFSLLGKSTTNTGK